MKQLIGGRSGGEEDAEDESLGPVAIVSPICSSWGCRFFVVM